MDSFIQSAAGTTYTGLATYGRIQSIMNTVGGFIVAIIFFMIGYLILHTSKADPTTGTYSEKVESNRRVAIGMMIIAVFIIVLVSFNLYFALHSKTYAAVQGGADIAAMI